MTVYAVIHKDNNTVSTRESDKPLLFAVVVKTPVTTRHTILDMVEQVDALTMDQIDRALSDGTVTEWGNERFVGGISAHSVGGLQAHYDMMLQASKQAAEYRESLVDLYQAVGWFEDLEDARSLATRLRMEYIRQDTWGRFHEVYVDFTIEA